MLLELFSMVDEGFIYPLHWGKWMDESETANGLVAVFVHLISFVFIQVFSEADNETGKEMKRRNVDSAKLRRTLKKNKISDGLCGRWVRSDNVI